MDLESVLKRILDILQGVLKFLTVTVALVTMLVKLLEGACRDDSSTNTGGDNQLRPDKP